MKSFYDQLRGIVAEHNTNIVTARQWPRVQTVWKPRTRSLQQEYEEGMRKLYPDWSSPKEDVLIIDYISIL